MKTRSTCLVAPCLLLLACGGGEPKAAAPTAQLAESSLAAPPPAAAAAAPTPSAAPSLSDFEGELALRLASGEPGQPPRDFTAHVKGKKLRVSLPEGMETGRGLGANAYGVLDVSSKQLFAVSVQRRQVMTMNLEAIGKQMDEIRADQQKKFKTTAPPKVDKTGKQDTVAGYACDEWEIIAADATKSRVCVASQRAAFFELPTVSLPSEHAWAAALFDGSHLPLRVIIIDAAGNEKVRVELTKLDPKPVADALFAQPEGYQVIDLAQMMRGIQEAMATMNPGAPGGPTSPPNMPPNVQAMMKQMREAQPQQGASGGGQPNPKLQEMLKRMAAQAQAAKSGASAEVESAKPSKPPKPSKLSKPSTSAAAP